MVPGDLPFEVAFPDDGDGNFGREQDNGQADSDVSDEEEPDPEPEEFVPRGDPEGDPGDDPDDGEEDEDEEEHGLLDLRYECDERLFKPLAQFFTRLQGNAVSKANCKGTEETV